jgi:quinol monooxygenase YgiN
MHVSPFTCGGESMAEQRGAPGAIELHLRIHVRPGKRDDFLAFLRDAIPFYESPGGIRIRLLQGNQDPDSFIEVVEYGDQGAYERDQLRVESDPAMNERLTRWRSLLAGPVAVEIYHVLAIEPAAAEADDRTKKESGGEP